MVNSFVAYCASSSDEPMHAAMLYLICGHVRFKRKKNEVITCIFDIRNVSCQKNLFNDTILPAWGNKTVKVKMILCYICLFIHSSSVTTSCWSWLRLEPQTLSMCREYTLDKM